MQKKNEAIFLKLGKRVALGEKKTIRLEGLLILQIGTVWIHFLF